MSCIQNEFSQQQNSCAQYTIIGARIALWALVLYIYSTWLCSIRIEQKSKCNQTHKSIENTISKHCDGWKMANLPTNQAIISVGGAIHSAKNENPATNIER